MEQNDTEDDFFISSVREKSKKYINENQENNEVITINNNENWDEDFDDKELFIPKSFQELQQALKSDTWNLRKFSLHMEGIIKMLIY